MCDEVEIRNPQEDPPSPLLQPDDTPKLTITRQPESFTRFRYASEVTKTTHGTLRAADAVAKSRHPQVELCAPSYESAVFHIVVFLCAGDLTAKELSPNVLRLKSSPKDVENDPKIFPMTKITNGVTKFVFDLENCYIQRLKGKEAETTCNEKHHKLESICPALSNQFSTKCKEKTNTVRLVFVACIKRDDSYEQFGEPVFSNVIRSGADFKIKKVCNTLVNIFGEEINLLISELDNDIAKNISIHLFEQNQNNETTWEKVVETVKVEQKGVISFNAPEYTGNSTDSTTKCWIELICKSSDLKSQASCFSYHRCCSCNPVAVDAMEVDEVDSVHANWQIDSMDVKQSFSQNKEHNYSLDDIFNYMRNGRYELVRKSNSEFQRHHKSGNTAFHELLSSKSSDFCEFMHISEMNSLYASALNANSENLLHYACMLNLPLYIGYFSRLKGMLYAYDCRLQTPLHIALDKGHNECITEFNQLFDTIGDDDPEMADKLKRLIEMPNRLGYTVLHVAVMLGYAELMQSVLHFCQRYKVDVAKLIEPSYGNTIIHLAVTNGQDAIVKLILDQLPESEFYTNYIGDTIYDVAEDMRDELSEGMLEIIETLK